MPARLADLPDWLTERERAAGVTDSNVAKRITFADSANRTAYSIVYLHGFSATRQETAPLSADVAHALSANLFETRLHGHGLPGDSLGSVTAKDWLTDAVDALEIGRRLGDSVVVIGTSTGGTLAAWLAALPRAMRSQLHAIVLISPNFGPKDPMAGVLTLPWASRILPRFIPTREWTAANEEQKRYWTMRYPSTALFPMQAMVEFVRTRSLEGYEVPTLTFYNPDDGVVDATRTISWLDRVNATSRSPEVRVVVTPPPLPDGQSRCCTSTASCGGAISLLA
jgi:esterase/lipase